MRIGIVTLFPQMFSALSENGVSGRAVKNGLLELNCWNPRDDTTAKHRTVDDRPYGGGPGMVMRPEPLTKALRVAKAKIGDSRVICLSPQGRRLDHGIVGELSQLH